MFRIPHITIFAVVITAVIALGLPMFFNIGSPTAFCPLTKAGAQNNPCLVQEATMSAMKNVILQNTIDNANLNATITAFKTQVASGASSASATQAPAVPGLPFKDTFDDNSHGWDLQLQDYGGGTLTKGQLVLQANNCCTWIENIPGMKVTNFYVEADFTPLSDNLFIGYSLSTDDKGPYYTISIDENLIMLISIDKWNSWNYNRWKFIQKLPASIPFQKEKPLKFGLEAKNGLYTVYINGQSQTSFQFTPPGNNLGIMIFGDNRDARVAMDNLVVRSSR